MLPAYVSPNDPTHDAEILALARSMREGLKLRCGDAYAYALANKVAEWRKYLDDEGQSAMEHLRDLPANAMALTGSDDWEWLEWQVAALLCLVERPGEHGGEMN